MTTQKALAAELWLMLAVQTIGAVDLPKPNKDGARKLPAPRNYAAAFLLWAILGIFAQLGPRQAKIATGIGGSAILAAVLVGVAGPGSRKPGEPIGSTVVSFLNRVSRLFAPHTGGQGTEGEPPSQPEGVPA